ncbi:uncharacterized protein LOC115633637 [Scaptodrosophila lebanonensis]|uniref:Uncharacterized protein LOC115633637 n=1 Tax=Drosophila lebanonensis TaxID=7225 RepID=A0A6J2UHJ9_DROLE|nr:uncharacterized protein LOC115633637 [Scaptodrosophila lebanonensis]
MEKLNDDAILSILSYLDLTDQQTMLSVHWRFYNLMPTVWCLKYKTINISFFEIQFTEEHLHYFLRSIMKTVEVMRLKMLTPENFEVLTTYEYPKVQDFRFAQTSCQFLCDSHIARIITAFPNIRTFSPHGSFSGAHLTEFSHLKSLTLSYCTKFKVENLVKIMQKHQLRELKLGIFDGKSVEMATLPIESMSGLELIKLDLDELSWFDKHFSDLVSLKQLIEKPWLWSVEGENSRLIVLTGKNYDYSYEPIYIVFK